MLASSNEAWARRDSTPGSGNRRAALAVTLEKRRCNIILAVVSYPTGFTAPLNDAPRERVRETFQGETVWEGEVLVFELVGHPSASRCYAWEVDGEVTAVLGEKPVDSALAAVRAAILADAGAMPAAAAE
jgi:hypothetical protein